MKQTLSNGISALRSKPVSPALHGSIDYGFGALQALLPPLLGLNRQAVRTYVMVSVPFLLVDLFTDTRAGLWRKIPFATHKKLDKGFLIKQGLLTFLPFIRNHRKALLFHLALLALSAAHYGLTDYQRGSR